MAFWPPVCSRQEREGPACAPWTSPLFHVLACFQWWLARRTHGSPRFTCSRSRGSRLMSTSLAGVWHLVLHSLLLFYCPQHFNSLPLKLPFRSLLILSKFLAFLLSPPFLKFLSFCDPYLNSQTPASFPPIQPFPACTAGFPAHWLTEHYVHVGT